MNEICPICRGRGKVDKDFGLGKCEKIPNDSNYRVCPGCEGKGFQYVRDGTMSYPAPIIIRKPRPRPPQFKRS